MIQCNAVMIHGYHSKAAVLDSIGGAPIKLSFLPPRTRDGAPSGSAERALLGPGYERESTRAWALLRGKSHGEGNSDMIYKLEDI
jgi:hypothetical protein